jgi:uncharacterized protein YggE
MKTKEWTTRKQKEISIVIENFNNKKLNKRAIMNKAILILLMSTTFSFTGELLPFPFIYVEGEADTSVAPNLAIITFRVKDLNVESSKAKESVEKISEEIINIVENNGIKSEDITAYEINKNIQQDYENKEMKILGYECTRKFEIKVKDLKNYDGISQHLFTMSNLDWLRVDFDRDDRKKIDSILILKSCHNAKEAAEQLATPLNAKVGKLYAISKSEFYSMPARFGLADQDGGRGSSTAPSQTKSFIPQTIEIHSSINTIFKMK